MRASRSSFLDIAKAFYMLSRGFTLIELLVVVAILAALASLGWSGYAHVYDDASDDLAQVQLDEVAKALRRFRADTGYWPGEKAADPTFIYSMVHAADLKLLAQAPADCGTKAICRWQAQARRGWHGPYLDPASFAWVRVFKTVDDVVSSYLVIGVSAGKPFKSKASGQYTWYESNTATGLVQRGRPIFFFPPRMVGVELFPASLVSAGADGDFGPDPELDSRNCAADQYSDASKDNLVVCL